MVAVKSSLRKDEQVTLVGFGTVYAGNYEPALRRFSFASNKLTESAAWKGTGGYVNGLWPTPDGKHVLTRGLDASLVVWEVATGKAVKSWSFHEQIGFGVAAVLNPATQGFSPLLGTLFGMTAVVVFLGLDGHHVLIQALALSVQIAPFARDLIDRAVLLIEAEGAHRLQIHLDPVSQFFNSAVHGFIHVQEQRIADQ